MDNHERSEIRLTVNIGAEVNLRNLDSLRLDLHDCLVKQLTPQSVIVSQPIPTRSLDPLVIGTLSLAILPTAIEKFADLLIKWVELRKDCSVTIQVPVKGASPAMITYNPKTTSPETLQKWIKTAVDATPPNKPRRRD